MECADIPCPQSSIKPRIVRGCVEDRTARFRTVVTLMQNGGIQQVEGVVNGRIALQEEGDGGFGYDPVFVPEGYEKTFASLPTEVKNAISHRGRAMEKLCEILNKENNI